MRLFLVNDKAETFRKRDINPMPVSAEIIILPKEREVNSGFVSPVRISAHAGIVVFAEKWYYYNGKAVLCGKRAYINGFLGNNRYFG